jgi:hypothetical protein
MEPMFIQALVLKPAIEALDIGVLRWLSRLNQLEHYVMFISSLSLCPTGKSCTLVCDSKPVLMVLCIHSHYQYQEVHPSGSSCAGHPQEKSKV